MRPVVGTGFLKRKAHVELSRPLVPDTARFCFSGENLVCESTPKLRL